MKIAQVIKAKDVVVGDFLQTLQGWQEVTEIDPSWYDYPEIKIYLGPERVGFKPRTRLLVMREVW